MRGRDFFCGLQQDGDWEPEKAAARGRDIQVNLALYPQLKSLCWSRPGIRYVTADEALSYYETEWRHVDEDRLTEREKDLIRMLVIRYGNGILHV